MTDVSFHTGVADAVDHACRVLRKAVRQGARVVVTGPTSTLTALDRALWVFEPLEFVAHLMRRTGQVLPARYARTPVWLLEDPADAPHHEVLLNLGDAVVPQVDLFSRVIEVVGLGPDDIAAGRARWKHYAALGWPIVHHEMRSAEDAR